MAEQPLVLIESMVVQHELPIGTKPVEEQRRSPVNIMHIKRQIESIKQKNEQRKRQLHEMFSHSFEELQGTQAKKPVRYMDTITERRNTRPPDVSLDVGRGRSRMIKQRKPTYNNPETRTPLIKTVRHFPQPTQESESRTHRFSQSKQLQTARRETPRLVVKRKLRVVTLKNEQIEQYQSRLLMLKEVYDCLMVLIKSVRGSHQLIEKAIYSYISCINCRELQFLDDFCQQTQPSVEKILRLSRALQNLTVMFLSLEVINGQINAANGGHAVNLIGHAAANIILFAKIFMLAHTTEKRQQRSSFELSILEFERESFGEQLIDFEEILTRIQHNNEILMLIEGKVGRFHPEFEVRVRHFLRTLPRNCYACSEIFYLLFEFLACYLHMHNLVNILPKLDTAPRPFLPEPTKPYTIVIDPTNVLVYQRRQKFYLRSYCSQFLQFIEQYCQIVLWCTSLPNEFDPVLALIDSSGKSNYRLYRYHCLHHGPEYIKDARMLGRDLTNLLLIDSANANYAPTPDHGIVMNWGGSERDRKLMDLCQLLTEVFRKETTMEEFLSTHTTELQALTNPRIRKRVH